MRDIPGSGIDQFAGYVEFVKFFPQQDSEVRRVRGIFCDLAFGWRCAVVEIDGWITCRDEVERGVFLDPGQDFIASSEERVEVALFFSIDFPEDAECVAAVDAVGCPFAHLAWIEGCLCSGDGGAGGF